MLPLGSRSSNLLRSAGRKKSRYEKLELLKSVKSCCLLKNRKLSSYKHNWKRLNKTSSKNSKRFQNLPKMKRNPSL